MQWHETGMDGQGQEGRWIGLGKGLGSMVATPFEISSEVVCTPPQCMRLNCTGISYMQI